MRENRKIRLDQLLLLRGIADSIEKAQAMILKGHVLVEDKPSEKAGTSFSKDVEIRIRKPERQWASRGAYKLLSAIQHFDLSLMGKVCLDVGASTGGFTDVMLSHGAERVYALDVAYGQLAWELRQNPKVVVMERQNARHITSAMFNPRPLFAASDASFISLKLLLRPISEVLEEGGEAVVLVKPQFEAPQGHVSKGGVVADPKAHWEVLEDLAQFIEKRSAFGLIGATYSNIRGPKGNIEFLYHLRKDAESQKLDLRSLILNAHRTLIGHEVELTP